VTARQTDCPVHQSSFTHSATLSTVLNARILARKTQSTRCVHPQAVSGQNAVCNNLCGRNVRPRKCWTRSQSAPTACAAEK
jgi:hypothetical protein